MIPAAFEYVARHAIPDALDLLQQHGDEAKILAGGHSLIPVMKLCLATPAYLVDINVEAPKVIGWPYSLLAAASRLIADPLGRNPATVGGNLAHTGPANDHPAVMLALER